jgi:uncharacterized protein (TIGR04255 family)
MTPGRAISADLLEARPYHRYRREPIVEAILDIRVAPTVEHTLPKLAQANSGLEQQYPNRSPVFRNRIQGNFSEGGPEVTADQATIGFVFVSADRQQQYQVTPDGLIFNRLAPYIGWEAFRDEARKTWLQFKNVLGGAVVVSRLGLRYINRIEIPARGAIELSDYFATVPHEGPELPQPMSGFFMRIETPLPTVGAGGGLGVVVAGTPAKQQNHVGVLLDIDAFKNISSAISDEETWSAIELLRNAKNAAFEACITDKTRKLID